MKKNAPLQIFLNGIFYENPIAVLFLSICPALALTTLVSSSLAMGIAFTAVILFSNVLISLLKNIIPESIQTTAYIIISAGIVSIISMIFNAYFFGIFEAIGIYLPLIVVNSAIVSRGKGFASKKSVLDSAVDGIGMGLGFTLVMFVMSTVRELLGAGTWFGMNALEAINGVFSSDIQPFKVLSAPAGGFFVYGVIAALFAYVLTKIGRASTGSSEAKSASQIKEEN